MTKRALLVVGASLCVGPGLADAWGAPAFTLSEPENLTVEQRTIPSGNLCGSAFGCAYVPLQVSAASAGATFEYRVREAASPTTVVQHWTPLGTGAAATSLLLARVPASTSRYLIDVRDDGANSSIGAGTEVEGPNRILVGDLTAFEGQSIAVAAFLSNTIGGDSGPPGRAPFITLAQSTGNATAPAYCAEYADYGNNLSATWETRPDAGTTNPVRDAAGLPIWGKVMDGSPSSYDSSGAVTLCKLEAARTGVAQGIVGYAVGNSQISVWQPGQHDQNRFMRILAAVTADQPDPTIAHLVWIQGQADGSNRPSPSTYQGELSSVLDNVYASYAVGDTSIETIAAEALSYGVADTHPEYDSIRWGGMQEVAVLTGSGRTAYYVDGLDMVESGDLVHPSQAVGAVHLATDLYRKLAYGTTETPLAITGATLDGRIVTLSIRNGGSTLNLLGPVSLASLFTVYPTGVHTGSPADTLGLAGASVTSPTTIALTLDQAPRTAVDVYYREPVDLEQATAATTISNDVGESDVPTGQQLALPSGPITTGTP